MRKTWKKLEKKLLRWKMDLCSCFHCGTAMESFLQDSERHSRLGGTRCFASPQFSVRSARSLKGLCFLTATLAFTIGIGIGLLIPLFIHPGDPGLPPSTAEPLSVINSTPNANLGDVSSRFPEFAQIEALSADRPPTPLYPMFRRPSPNVHFVSPDSRILSLHPVQQEIPAAEFPIKPLKKRKVGESSSELVDGIYWSRRVEAQLPKGFTEEEVASWRRFVSSAGVTQVEEGCGRMQNRLLTFENGTRACCRYRQNFDQIQGEIFSFYLGQVLGLRNLVPSALGLIQPQDKKWSGVKQELNLAQWAEQKPVVLTQFVPNLTPAHIPAPLRDSSRRLHPVDLLLSSSSVVMDGKELAQWSDLILFDYLTANLDRMVNNLYNLQWNPSMMEAPAHNLAKDPATGLLVFLDNESGLLHGYRLLEKYETYHRMMLDSLCVFRRDTANAIKALHRDKNVGKLLKKMFSKGEANFLDFLPMIPDKSIKILNKRIDRVYDQITKCESLYNST